MDYENFEITGWSKPHTLQADILTIKNHNYKDKTNNGNSIRAIDFIDEICTYVDSELRKILESCE